MAKLSDAQLTTMSRASRDPQGLLSPAPKTPVHMAHAIAKKLADLDMVERLPVQPHEPWYERNESTNEFFGYRLNLNGFMALGITSSEWPEYCQPHDETPEDEARLNALVAGVDTGTATETQAALEAKLAPVAPAADKPLTLRAAGEAILAAWGLALTMGSEGMVVATLKPAMANLRSALGEPKTAKAAKAPRAPRVAGEPKAPREGTKQQMVIDMLKRTDGVTNPEIQEATGWAPHTVRGFFAGLKKKGMTVESVKTDAGMVYRINT